MGSPNPLRLLLVLLLVLVPACATGGTGSGGSSPDTLTQDDLADYQNSDVYQALRRLEPTWLRYRGGEPEVLVDGLRRGPVQVLRQILVQDVGSITFLSPSEATNRYGTGFLHGAILIESR